MGSIEPFFSPNNAARVERASLNGQRIFAQIHVAVYRMSRGRLGGWFRKSPVLLLTTIGRKSRNKRTTPVLYLEDGENLVLVASNAGKNRDPFWWMNLKDDPSAVVQVRGRTMEVRAAQATPEEKSRYWPSLVKMYPAYDDYQKKTVREIPVVILRPFRSES